MMSKSNPRTIEIQSNHLHWLREIERWESQLDLWENEQGLLTRELARLQQIIQKHGTDLASHAAAIKALKAEIAATEREIVAAQGNEHQRSLVEMHLESQNSHAAQRDLHEQIKRRHHILIAQLAMRQHEPLRDD